MTDKFIRINEQEAVEIQPMLNAICKYDLRTEGNEVAVLIRQEYARRFSQPSPFTVEDAEASHVQ